MSTHPVVEVNAPDGTILLIAVDRRTEFGRACHGVLLNDDRLSRRHLAVWPEPGRLMVDDLGSSNGTTLDGGQLGGPTPFVPGSTIRAGDTTIVHTSLVAGPQQTSLTPSTGRNTLVGATGSSPFPDGATDVRGPGSVVRPANPDDPSRRSAIATMAGRVDHRASVDGLVPGTGGTVTFLFSDIEQSTERAARLGDADWFSFLRRYGQLVESTVAAHDGRVVDSTGDGHMATFPSANGGSRCAIELQRSLSVFAPDDPVAVRIGLHTGEAIESNGRLIGLHVHTASRVADLACGGQILVSEVTRAIAEPAGSLSFRPERQVELRGIVGTHRVSELEWQEARPDPTG